MREPVGEGRVEDHLQPARHMRLAANHFKACRCVHPGIKCKDPESRQRGATGDQQCCDGVHPLADAFTAKQHHAQHRCFKEKRGQHFIGQQRPSNVSDLFHITWPIGAKLETHGDAADDTQRKGQCKNLHPELVGIHPMLRFGPDKPQLEKKQHPGQ